LNIQGEYQFDASKKNLEIFAGSLKYDPNRIYEFNVQTTHLNKVFNQTVRITVDIANTIPIISLG